MRYAQSVLWVGMVVILTMRVLAGGQDLSNPLIDVLFSKELQIPVHALAGAEKPDNVTSLVENLSGCMPTRGGLHFLQEVGRLPVADRLPYVTFLARMLSKTDAEGIPRSNLQNVWAHMGWGLLNDLRPILDKWQPENCLLQGVILLELTAKRLWWGRKAYLEKVDRQLESEKEMVWMQSMPDRLGRMMQLLLDLRAVPSPQTIPFPVYTQQLESARHRVLDFSPDSSGGWGCLRRPFAVLRMLGSFDPREGPTPTSFEGPVLSDG